MFKRLKISLNTWSKKLLNVDFNEIFSLPNILANIPFLLFLFLLTIFYIGGIHTVENTTRRTNKLKSEIKEIRWEYMSIKADLMYKSKQTEVAKSVESLGLKELKSPPKKIVIAND